MTTVVDDIAALETNIKAALTQARHVHRRVMRETEDTNHGSALALLELCTRSLAQADDAARYGRHEFGYPKSSTPLKEGE